MKDIVVVGAGGFGREVRWLIDDINTEKPTWNLVGFLITDGKSEQTEVEGLPVLSMEDLSKLNLKNLSVTLGVGHPHVKLKLRDELKHLGDFPTLVHPSVKMSKRVHISKTGVIVTAGNILTTNVKLDDFTMINLSCTIGHDVKIGSFSVLSPGVNVSGYVSVGEGCNIGTGSKVIEGKSIGQWSIIGAGSVVTTDIPSDVTAVGVPAKVIKQRDSGWQYII